MSERRIEVRLLCADLVDVRWRDKSGRTRRVTASLEDISDTGACVQLERPLALGTRVTVTYPNGELTGSVRYCLFNELGYFVGLEFDPGCGWNPADYQPKHLLDPRAVGGDLPD
jgi:hypothetical protein